MEMNHPPLKITPGMRKRLIANGFSGARISNWKRGLARPRKEEAHIVALILRMSVWDLIGIQRPGRNVAA
jgi:hypothetical protein